MLLLYVSDKLIPNQGSQMLSFFMLKYSAFKVTKPIGIKHYYNMRKS